MVDWIVLKSLKKNINFIKLTEVFLQSSYKWNNYFSLKFKIQILLRNENLVQTSLPYEQLEIL